MTRRCVPTILLTGSAVLLIGSQAFGDPSPYEPFQPIVLTDVPRPCASPARLGQPLMSAELMPLAAGTEWRGYGSAPIAVAPVVEYRLPAPVVAPGVPVEAFRPVVAPSVPNGYVVGRGLLGQAKLYKPGQPVRNALRYLSP